MKAIIPLAGSGKRLRPLTSNKPKPMIEIAGKPILGHILDNLVKEDIKEYIFIVGDNPKPIIEYVSKKYKKIKAIYIKQKTKKGNAHAVLGASKHVSKEPIIILFGDTIINLQLKKNLKKKGDGLIWVKEVEDPTKYGVVLTKKGYITNIIEKPSSPISNLAVTGAYFIKDAKNLFEAIKSIIKADIKINGEYYLTSALDLLIQQRKKFIAVKTDKWLDCGNIKKLLEANQDLLKNKARFYGKKENSIILKPVYVGKESYIVNSIIGPNVSIGKNVYIENSVIDNSIIGSNAEITNATIGNSVIGEKAIVKRKKEKLYVGDYSALIDE